MRTPKTLAIASFIISCLTTLAWADIPHQMNVQGVLVDTSGASMTNVTVEVTFTIYDAASGGTAKWTEIDTVITDGAGVFSIPLGAESPIPDSVFSDTVRWLGIQVEAEPELTPRTQLVSGPYSYVSGNGGMGTGGAWVDDGSVVRLVNGTDSVGIGTSSPGELLEVAGNALITGKATIGSKHTNTGVAAFVAGDSSTASGFYSTVGGGLGNESSNDQTVVAGGAFNTASGVSTVVSGGFQNAASGQDATVAGGFADTASGYRSTVSGGNLNSATGDGATVGGGFRNLAGGDNSAVGGGMDNVATGQWSTVGGGDSSTASGSRATIGGGQFNVAIGNAPTVGGGKQNTAINFGAVVGGGIANTAGHAYTTVAGGSSNLADSISATVAGGSTNTASAVQATIGGGANNSVLGENSTVSGGFGGLASGRDAAVGGGASDTASGDGATIGGGIINVAGGARATIAGGIRNRADGFYSSIGGGRFNYARGISSTVSGGGGSFLSDSNSAIGDFSSIGGGVRNVTAGLDATIGGGNTNSATGVGATVAGGDNNAANDNFASVGGGQFDTAGGIWSTVPGGYLNKAAGNYSLAAGKRAKALHSGAFVWADAFSNLDFASTNANQFLIRSQFTGIGRNYRITGAETFGIKRATAGFGGMYMETDAGGEPFYGYATDSIARAYHFYNSADSTWRLNIGGGDRLVLRSNGYLGVGDDLPSTRISLPNIVGSPGIGRAWSWITYSSRRWKTDIQTMSDALSKVGQLRGVTYKDKTSGTPTIGVIAEEVGEVFPEIVTYEDNGVDANSVDYARLVSVLIEAVKELKDRSDSQAKELGKLRSQVEAMSVEPRSVNKPADPTQRTEADPITGSVLVTTGAR